MSSSSSSSSSRVFALVVCLVASVSVSACSAAYNEEERAQISSSITGSNIGSVRITHYTIAKESDYASEQDFLCSGTGVAMQGTGIRRDGSYVRYLSGGGGWCGNALCNCGSARFGPAQGAVGRSGRILIENYSIAVDPNRIALGSYVWLSEVGHWFRADDTGGLITGMHIDVFVGLSNASGLPQSSSAFVTSTPHEAGDPGPNGEDASSAGSGSGSGSSGNAQPPFVASDRPSDGPFPALDVRYPVGADGYITQCSEGADGERVWLTTSTGNNPSSRWAVAKYPQMPGNDCGAARDGHRPLVFRSEPAGTLGGTWITSCADEPGIAHVFRVQGDDSLDGHPMAPFHHNENDSTCSR